MPLYLDVHRNLDGTTPEDIERAHYEDEKVQAEYGVHYHRFFFNEEKGTVFCLVEGPSKKACADVHREAHGLLAESIIEVEPDLVDAFLGSGGKTPQGAAVTARSEPDTAFRAILFSEIESFPALAQERGEAAAIEALERHDRTAREQLLRQGGRESAHTGGGVLATFPSAAEAVTCGLAIRAALAEGDDALEVCVGVSAGEPVERHNELFGVAVEMARRLCESAQRGQVLASNAVRELCMGKSIEFADRGEVRLRGFDEDVRVFVAAPRETRAPAPSRIERRLAAILSADGVGYSARMAEDPEATLRALHDTRARVRHAVEQHGGRVVDSPGDNLLAEFPTALDAVRSAVVIQEAGLDEPFTLQLRIGVHLGEVMVQHGRLYGDGVNITARLEGLAEAGGICISRAVHELVERALAVGFQDLGEQAIKNLKPVQVFRIQLPR